MRQTVAAGELELRLQLPARPLAKTAKSITEWDHSRDYKLFDMNGGLTGSCLSRDRSTYYAAEDTLKSLAADFETSQILGSWHHAAWRTLLYAGRGTPADPIVGCEGPGDANTTDFCGGTDYRFKNVHGGIGVRGAMGYRTAARACS